VIFNSHYWRAELGRLAATLRRHTKQRRWPAASGASDASVEKCVMLGFSAIRKMSDKTTFQPVKIPGRPKIQVIVFPRNTDQKLSSISWPSVEEAFWLTRPASTSLPVITLCNQIVHTHYFALWFNPSNRLRGIFFCSDDKKDEEVYRLEAETIVKLFEDVAQGRERFVSFGHFYPEHNRVVMP
jgi:hypothetical protein